MLYESRFVGLVIIRGNHQQTVCSGTASVLGKRDCVIGIVASCTCNDRNSACGNGNRVLDNAAMLIILQSRAFTGGTAYNYGIYAGRDLTLDKGGKRKIIYLSILEGSYERCSCSGKYYRLVS